MAEFANSIHYGCESCELPAVFSAEKVLLMIA